MILNGHRAGEPEAESNNLASSSDSGGPQKPWLVRYSTWAGRLNRASAVRLAHERPTTSARRIRASTTTQSSTRRESTIRTLRSQCS